MRFVEVLDTPATPRAAFSFLADFANLGAWDPSIERVERLDRGPLGVGSRFRVTLRFLGVASVLDYRVERYAPPRHAVLVGTGPLVTATDAVSVEPRRGGCRVTWDADIRFALPLRALDPVFAWLFASSVAAAIGNLGRALAALPRPARRVVAARRARPLGGRRTATKGR